MPVQQPEDMLYGNLHMRTTYTHLFIPYTRHQQPIITETIMAMCMYTVNHKNVTFYF